MGIPAFPEEERAAIERRTIKSPGQVSALDIIPLFDKELAVTYDPMHMLCMGVIKVFFKHIMYVGDKYHRSPAIRAPQESSVAILQTNAGSAQDKELVDDESSEEEPLANNADAAGPIVAPPVAPGRTSQGTGRAVPAPKKDAGTASKSKGPALPKQPKKSKPMLLEHQKVLYHQLMQEVSVIRLLCEGHLDMKLILASRCFSLLDWMVSRPVTSSKVLPVRTQQPNGVPLHDTTLHS